MAKGSKEVTVSKGTLERMPRPFGDIDRLFDDFIGRRFLRPFGWESALTEAQALMPSVDYRSEISQGSFSRTIALPAEVDDSKAKASIKDGMLELTLPKVEKSRRHSIAIS